MKITTIQDVDLSQYKIAYYVGDSLGHTYMCQDDVMKLADAGNDFGYEINNLNIALIPKDKRLQDCSGDDWDDFSAKDNASGFYKYPEGTIFMKGGLGGQLQLCDKF